MKDVVEYIKVVIIINYEDDSVPVFTQKSITDMYDNRFIYHGSQYDSIDAAAFARNSHVTWLREKYWIRSLVFVLTEY